MAAPRYVVAGLARARVEWFRDVASWSTSGALPVEFIGCLSVEELKALADGGRAVSAALLDAGLPHIDRDLIAHLRENGVAALFVESAGARRGSRELGAAATLPAPFRREQLLDALRASARPVGPAELPEPEAVAHDDGASVRAPVISVCGPGGTGASTLAIALAQGLAAAPPRVRPPRSGLAWFRALGGARSRSGQPSANVPHASEPVVLADLCLRADQAALHDARDIVPGVQELVEAHRVRRPAAGDIRAMTFRVEERNYHLLLGLRRSANWSTIRPRTFSATLDGLRTAFSQVVADVEADLESERDAGSIDVEERTVMARTATAASSVVVVVGRPGLSGLTGLIRTLQELLAHGVDGERLLPVCSPAPRSPAARAEYQRALTQLLSWPSDVDTAPAVLFLPRRRIDEALRDGAPIPKPIPDLLTRAVRHILETAGPKDAPPAGPEPVRAGTLGAT